MLRVLTTRRNGVYAQECHGRRLLEWEKMAAMLLLVGRNRQRQKKKQATGEMMLVVGFHGAQSWSPTGMKLECRGVNGGVGNGYGRPDVVWWTDRFVGRRTS